MYNIVRRVLYAIRMELDPPVARTGGVKPRREVVIGVRLTIDALAAIDELADKEQRTRSDMIRILLRAGLEARR